MTYDEATLRLAHHAGFAGERPPMEESLTGAYGRPARAASPPTSMALADDVIACLDAASRELNGPVPSKRIERAKERVIGDLAYHVSSILDDLLRPHDPRPRVNGSPARDALIDAAIRINLAWNLVLAGDMDDIPNDTRVELRAKAF